MKLRINQIVFKFCILLLGPTLLAQNQNPAVSSAVHYEEYPVDLSTGLPQVGIPIFSMPTRSDRVSIDLNISYHPSSISPYLKRGGNCGSGWNLTGMGAIAKSDLQGGVYNINFLGFSGKLTAFTFNGVDTVTITDNGGGSLTGTLEKTSGNSITAINLYDDKGFRYRFSAIDIVKTKINGTYVPVTAAYQITEIYDTNNNILVYYTYDNYDQPERTSSGSYVYHNLKIMTSIVSPGFGKVLFTNDAYSETEGLWVTCSAIDVFNEFDQPISNVVLGYETKYDSSIKLTDINLAQVTKSVNNVDPQVYSLYYRPAEELNEFMGYIRGVDKWGYYNKVNKWCNSSPTNELTSLERLTGGVLEKITLPTGGCIIYNYESNTYSYDGGVAFDTWYNPTTQVIETDPNYFVNLDEPENRHNFVFSEYASLNTSFTINQPTVMYFKFGGNPKCVDFGGGQMPCLYPSFTLKNITNPSSPTVIGTYGIVDGYRNDENYCLGSKRTLQPGTYIIENGASGITPSASAYTITVKPTQARGRWWNGGGIRVKSIAFFDGESIPQNYFDLWPTDRPVADRLLTYNYNTFADNTRSSGSTTTGDANNYAPVLYSNVTVTEGSNLGRTEYTFYSPIDFSSDNFTYTSDFRMGKIKGKKVYDKLNSLLQEQTYEYNSIVSAVDGTQTDLHNMGWMVPSQTITKEYFADGVNESKELFEYFDNRKLKQRSSSTSRSNENLITKYFYHTGNSPYSINRIGELDHMENYSGSNPISSIKVEYNNNWYDALGTTLINQAFLPQKILSSKDNSTFYSIAKVNLYDKYGHALETQEENDYKMCYIYGYNESLIVASVSNISYNDIPPAIIAAIKTASNANDNNALTTALTSLRNASQLSNSVIQTFTYKPLVGVLTKTDVRGISSSVEYNQSNKPVATKDYQGNLIQESQYHIKNQN